MLVVVGGVFGSRLGPDMQVYMALAVIMMFMIVHLAWRPFDELTPSHRILHWLELSSLMVCWGTLYCGMLFWIGDRLPREFQVFVSICIVGGNTLFTVLILAVFARATVKESREHGDQSELALKTILRRRSRGVRSERTRSRGSINRNGTIKGSLRYTAKVALQLKRAQANAESYAETSCQMKRQLDKKRKQATMRLKLRLIKRASKSGKGMAKVRAAIES